jgi:glutamine amidotransferase
MSKVTIIDYGHGNANSIKSALASLGVTSTYSRETKDIDSADFLILPGVGHHAAAMKSLHENDLCQALNRAVRERRIPTLGICLGMQIMTRSSEEGGAAGLGWVPAVTERIAPTNKTIYKVPHVGWNVVSKSADSALLAGIDTEAEPFYFCHSFAVKAVVGVQFHPEKSQEPGARLLANFLQLKP